jgi:hypothetical protein
MDVSREITLPVDRDSAWEAVSDLDRWLTQTGGDLDLRPGAEGELTLPDGEVRWATIEEVLPGERLSWWWHSDGALATLVELQLVDAVSGGTRIVVVESGYAGQPICGSPWAGGASNGPRALSAAAGTASPSYPLGSAWVVRTLEWQPPLARLHDSLDLVAA